MKRYLVGGAVRDALLGLPVVDRDWVVVGADVDALLAAGYQAVGADFPVFLHPETREEHALARTERKTAPGYRGFAFHAGPEVTLEEDLLRRDLTINAMAEDEDGDADRSLRRQGRPRAARCFRHVSPAFAEDPVRILRLARFAARFPTSASPPETDGLMRRMVEAGEADALVPERVWREVSRGLMEARPSRMFEVLRACGALERVLPEVGAAVRRAAARRPPPGGRHRRAPHDGARHGGSPRDLARGALRLSRPRSRQGHDAAEILPQHLRHESAAWRWCARMSERLRVDNACRSLAELTAREHGNVHRSGEFGAAALVRLLERCDALRRPERFAELLLACECDARGRLGLEERPYPQRRAAGRGPAPVAAVDATAVAAAASAARRQRPGDRPGDPRRPGGGVARPRARPAASPG